VDANKYEFFVNANKHEFFVNSNCMTQLIFDEADQLLDMGFKDDMNRIASFLKSDHQTYMFSATLSPKIKAIAQATLKDNHC
jgi:ATP-dependent RNA helicase RhlE